MYRTAPDGVINPINTSSFPSSLTNLSPRSPTPRSRSGPCRAHSAPTRRLPNRHNPSPDHGFEDSVQATDAMVSVPNRHLTNPTCTYERHGRSLEQSPLQGLETGVTQAWSPRRVRRAGRWALRAVSYMTRPDSSPRLWATQHRLVVICHRQHRVGRGTGCRV